MLLAAAALLVIAGLTVLAFRSPPPAEPIRIAPATLPTRPLHVHVAGEVVSPGVYTLEPGSLIADAVAAAGGATAEADLDRLDLAARLRDEERIVVPTRGQHLSNDSGRARISLNRATQAELESLPGIGPKTAERILQSREQDGPFRSVAELRERGLLGPTTFERVRELVDVS